MMLWAGLQGLWQGSVMGLCCGRSLQVATQPTTTDLNEPQATAYELPVLHEVLAAADWRALPASPDSLSEQPALLRAPHLSHRLRLCAAMCQYNS
jgi:hypothetical protein